MASFPNMNEEKENEMDDDNSNDDDRRENEHRRKDRVDPGSSGSSPRARSPVHDSKYPFGLPVEIWVKIFTHLTDADLLRRVVPVCRFFRLLAYDAGFRFTDIRPLNQIRDRWYDFSPEFLRRIREPISLEFEYRPLFDVENENENENAETKILEMLEAYPNLSKLAIGDAVRLIERFDDVNFCDAVASDSQYGDFQFPREEFLIRAMTSCSELRELKLLFRCGCLRHQGVNENRFYESQMEAICICGNLRKLMIAHRIDGRACQLMARSLTNLTELHLIDCRNLNEADIKSLAKLSRLNSLRLERLGGVTESILPIGPDEAVFAENLTVLGLHSTSTDPVNLDHVFAACRNLVDLYLDVPLGPRPNFSPLVKLKRFDCKCKWLPEVRSFLLDLPYLTDLHIYTQNLPSPTHSDADLQFIFGKLESLRIKDLTQLNRSQPNPNLQILRCILPHCLGLRELGFEDHKSRYLESKYFCKEDDIALAQITPMMASLCLRSFYSTICPINKVAFSLMNWNCTTTLDLTIHVLEDDWFEKLCKEAQILKVLSLRYENPMNFTCIKSLKYLEHLTLFKGYRRRRHRLTALRPHYRDTREGTLGMLSICNAAFPLDPDKVDRLSLFPRMRSFQVHSGENFEYHLRKTCLGEVKRYVVEHRRNIILKPADILSNGSNLALTSRHASSPHEIATNRIFY